MTEKDWEEADDPFRLLAFVRGKASDRQLRHLMLAFVEWLVRVMPDNATEKVIDLLSTFADGGMSRKTLDQRLDRYSKSCGWFKTFGYPWSGEELRPSLYEAAESALVWCLRPVMPDDVFYLNRAIEALSESDADASARVVAQARADNIRDIFGNPFRSVALDPGWRTSTVVTLAEGIYADRAFDRLPILADALQDAGCDHPDILAHCRSDGPHVRGCWIVDLLLGKS